MNNQCEKNNSFKKSNIIEILTHIKDNSVIISIQTIFEKLSHPDNGKQNSSSENKKNGL